jgi:hypothetical protein
MKKRASETLAEMLHCIACDVGKEPAWTEYKQDTLLKHIAKRFSAKGELIARTDRNTGAFHSKKIVEYEECLKNAKNPCTLL